MSGKPAERPVSNRAQTVTIPLDEYAWLCEIMRSAITVRDKGVMAFNRLPVEMRLAITSLAAHYREQGYGDDGLPKNEQVVAMFEAGRGGAR